MQYKYPPQSFTLFSLQLLYQRSPTVPTSAKTTNYPRTSSFTTLISNAISSTSTSHSVCIVMMLHFNSIHWDHQFYTLKFFGVLLDLNTLDDLEALFDLSKRHRRVDLLRYFGLWIKFKVPWEKCEMMLETLFLTEHGKEKDPNWKANDDPTADGMKNIMMDSLNHKSQPWLLVRVCDISFK
jgi:hypothetical protein